jgi:hypothetical protein|tara:strand:+ start:840 stop:1418 length:579 start_codon:yes stop_codon:yes gene_type:complete
MLREGGLWCDAERLARRLGSVGIAHQHIKERRARKVVPVASGGTLADYVPFYFAPRSPMLFAIHKGAVEDYRESQREILHLVSSIDAVQPGGSPWCFTDGHAEMLSSFSDDLEDLDEYVDWPIMRAHYWADTADDNDRKRRRQAEFLVHRFFPWAAISEIGVVDDEMAMTVSDQLDGSANIPAVNIQRSWYY